MNINHYFRTCRERFRRKADPNVPDENFSFIADPRFVVPNNAIVQEWRSNPEGLVLKSLPGNSMWITPYPTGGHYLSPIRTNENGHYAYRTGFGAVHDHASTKELYFRIIYSPPSNYQPDWAMDEHPIALIQGADDVPRMRLTAQVVGRPQPKAWIYRLTIKPPSGEEYTITSTEVPMYRDETPRMDIKVQIPAAGMAAMQIVRYLTVPVPGFSVTFLGQKTQIPMVSMTQEES